jgi:peptidoglycan/xylan/chitin deacetylase (PgdA/CDA1 family)
MNAHQLTSVARSVAGRLANRLGAGPSVCRGKVAILQYHRVVTREEFDRDYIEPAMYVLNDAFERQLRWLSEQFEILSFAQLLARWNADEWDERKAYCVLTFDDGWLDNYRHAFPVLSKYGVPATVFLPTNYIGSNEWFWPEKVTFLLSRLEDPRVTSVQRKAVNGIIAELPGLARREIVGERGIHGITMDKIIGQCKLLSPNQIDGMLSQLSEILEASISRERATINWGEVTEMANGGISFGSHSCSHHLLTKLDEPAIRKELEDSNQVLQALPGYIPVFCYPNGDNNHAIQDLVRQSQYVAAVGTRRGLEGRRPDNLYELRRIGMHNDISETIPLLSLHLFRAAVGF